MTITIHADWWLLPLAVTIIAFGWTTWIERDNTQGGDYSFSGIVSAFNYGVALIVSLIAWLIWAVLK